MEGRALAIDDEVFPVTISIGVADLEHAPAHEPHALMDAAANALAAAQREGPNRVRPFHGPNSRRERSERAANVVSVTQCDGRLTQMN